MMKTLNFHQILGSRFYQRFNKHMIESLKRNELLYNKEKTYFLCLSVRLTVSHHFVLTGKSSCHKTVATRFFLL